MTEDKKQRTTAPASTEASNQSKAQKPTTKAPAPKSPPKTRGSIFDESYAPEGAERKRQWSRHDK